MPEQVAPPPAPDAATPEPAVETPQAAAPQQAKPESAAETPPASSRAEPPSRPPSSSRPPSRSRPPRPPPAAPSRRRRSPVRRRLLGIVGAILAVVVVAGLKFGVASAIGNYFNKDETADAKAGDCIAELPEVTGTEQEKVDGAKVVECTSTDAAYNVVGRVDGQSEAQAKAGTACDPVLQGGPGGLHLLQHRAGQDGLPALPDQEGLTTASDPAHDGGGSRPAPPSAYPESPAGEQEVNATVPASSRRPRPAWQATGT